MFLCSFTGGKEADPHMTKIPATTTISDFTLAVYKEAAASLILFLALITMMSVSADYIDAALFTL